MNNYYQLLGLDEHATVSDIRKAYRKIAIKLHPNVNKNPQAHSEFIELSKAYQVLNNSVQRKRYDALIKSKHLKKADSFYHFKRKAEQNARNVANMNDTKFKKEQNDLDYLMVFMYFSNFLYHYFLSFDHEQSSC